MSNYTFKVTITGFVVDEEGLADLAAAQAVRAGKFASSEDYHTHHPRWAVTDHLRYLCYPVGGAAVSIVNVRTDSDKPL